MSLINKFIFSLIEKRLKKAYSSKFSVHGANRLGTNSLIDLVVFGKASSLTAKTKVKPNSKKIQINFSKTESIIDRFI